MIRQASNLSLIMSRMPDGVCLDHAHLFFDLMDQQSNGGISWGARLIAQLHFSKDMYACPAGWLLCGERQ